MIQRIDRSALTEEIARTVLEVPGVAFLRPGLANLLGAASAASGADARQAGVSSAGVRVRGGADGPWHVEIRLVALHADRTLDVARAARRAVEEHLAALLPKSAPRADVTVTVTGRV
ncbi:hypothetical protein EF919_39810 [Streptomyces sp. WAC02707]|uniref:hypothetical protein n=1 Tax=Streptomyces sp. WAC02707 TaxID=2487417 RepID=UPI000F79CB71|nr:hypothetical protein [Streptomyces sp. WAC02707]RSS82066.1 hypothetical protein EF919_39810 [Streptomyces sp. WAC02707]